MAENRAETAQKGPEKDRCEKNKGEGDGETGSDYPGTVEDGFNDRRVEVNTGDDPDGGSPEIP